MSFQTVGMIGLGLLGSALAERFLANGFEVVGHDIDPKRGTELGQLGGRSAGTADEVAAACPRIVICLPDSDVVEGVLQRLSSALKSGQILLDTTTGDPARMEQIGARLNQEGIAYLDATISGSSAQVRKAEVTVMAGGAEDTFVQCQDLFRCFASHCFRVGAWGSGGKMKLVTNLVLGLNRAALAEGLALAKDLNVSSELALQVLQSSMAYSRIMDTKGLKMVREDFEPQAKLSQHFKDVNLILQAAQASDLTLPLSQAHSKLLQTAIEAGYGDLDNSAIVKVFDQLDSKRRHS